MKDNFSTQSKEYAQFRPEYPLQLYDFLFSLVTNKERAWDCATGNGQVAKELSKAFKEVHATDISEAQIQNAFKADNIYYKVESAEHSTFPAQYFDLITVAQAIHWFNFKNFYSEVRRTLKPGGILAVIGYGLFGAGKEVDEVVQYYYSNILGRYWDSERKYLDENYKTIPFPFEEIPAPLVCNEYDWSLGQLTGYLQTWSAVQHYIKTNREEPLALIMDRLKEAWGDAVTRRIRFNILLRVAKM